MCSVPRESRSAPWVSVCARFQQLTLLVTPSTAGTSSAAMAFAASAISAPMSGASVEFCSKLWTEKFFSDTTVRNRLFAIWIQSLATTRHAELHSRLEGLCSWWLKISRCAEEGLCFSDYQLKFGS